MNNFLIVGIPIVTGAASPEFRLFLSRTDVVCVTSVGYDVTNWERSRDYVSAKAGHDLLLQHGFQFIRPWEFSRLSGRVVVMMSFWQSRAWESRRTTEQVMPLLSGAVASIQKVFPERTVAYLTPGSPYTYDGISRLLLNAYPSTQVIDTPSSLALAYEALRSNGLASGPMKIVAHDNALTESATNLIGCWDSTYGSFINPDRIIEQLRPEQRFYSLEISDAATINRLTAEQFSSCIRGKYEPRPSILAVLN